MSDEGENAIVVNGAVVCVIIVMAMINIEEAILLFLFALLGVFWGAITRFIITRTLAIIFSCNEVLSTQSGCLIIR